MLRDPPADPLSPCESLEAFVSENADVLGLTLGVSVAVATSNIFVDTTDFGSMRLFAANCACSARSHRLQCAFVALFQLPEGSPAVAVHNAQLAVLEAALELYPHPAGMLPEDRVARKLQLELILGEIDRIQATEVAFSMKLPWVCNCTRPLSGHERIGETTKI